MKEDLTQYTDSELSLRVFNDEGLYRGRHMKGFMYLLEDIFIFTHEQEDELLQDLQDDLEEVA